MGRKNQENIQKHGVSFEEAQEAFIDPNRILVKDTFHSTTEERWFCVGNIEVGIVTVRFIYREEKIRIFGAGYWRKMKKKYLKKRGAV